MQANDFQALEEQLFEEFIERLRRRDPCARIDYRFHMPLEGAGWHPRETNGSAWWRFTGPGPTARIYFPRLDARDRTLKLAVFHAVTPAHLEGLSVRCNGVELARTGQEDAEMVFEIPAAALRANDFVELVFQTPPPVRPGPADDRELGIALQGIEIS